MIGYNTFTDEQNEWFKILRKDPRKIRDIPYHFRRDYRFIRIAIRNNIFIVDYIDETIISNKEFRTRVMNVLLRDN